MELKGRTIGGLAGGLGLAVFLITAFEGRVLHIYPDPVTHATPWTYCDGETTTTPQWGHVFTNAECDAITVAEVKTLDAKVTACVGRPLPDKVRAAFDSLAWNIGVGAFCGSTVVKKAKAGDLAGACGAMLAWDHAGGHVIPGLTVRRNEEYAYCLDGVEGS